jgi:ribonuclease HI
MNIPSLPLGGASKPSSTLSTAQIPHPWNPVFQPEQWVYTDGSDITGQPRLGAAVVHFSTCTIIYIDAGGTDKTRTIMQAELVAIYKAVDKFAAHEWLGILKNSLSSFQAIRHRYTKPGAHGSQHYHHHNLLLSGITDLLEERRRRGFSTSLHKIRAHTNIRGNDLADAAAKIAVKQYESLPESQKLRVTVGEAVPRPPYWVMYTVKPLPPPLQLGTDTRMATLRQPWWSIPEGDRLHMHAFTRPSTQLRHKVRHALLRSLNFTSLYKRLILQNIEVGKTTQSVGKAIHRRLTANAWEGITLLKFIYGQSYNGKLAKRYGHVATDECQLCHKPDSCTHIAG